MTIYIGPTYPCPPTVSDLIKVREGCRVARMTADDRIELRTFARQIGVSEDQFMGHGLPSWRYLIKLDERYRAIAAGAVEVTSRRMSEIEASRTSLAALRRDG